MRSIEPNSLTIVLSLNPTLPESPWAEPLDLLERARAGDAEAFSELARAYETRLLRQALFVCGPGTLAEDLAQETLIEAWKSLHRYDGSCRFFTWLCAILLNRHRNSLRSKWLSSFLPLTHLTAESEESPQTDIATVQAQPDQAAVQEERAAAVRRCVRALPAKHQQVIHLRFYVDASLEGIAAALGCSVGTVKSRLFHALDKLRHMREFSAIETDLKTGA